MGFGSFLKKSIKVVSGYQAYQYRKEAKNTLADAQFIKEETETANREASEDLNEHLEEYGLVKIDILKKTIGVLQKYLKQMEYSNKDKYYEVLGKIDFQENEIKTMETVEMNASNAALTAGAGGVAASIALTGVPTAVTGAVSALATASTGTAISTLHGAAATNATMAWLGGGAIKAGGGGIAAGAANLSLITGAATGIAAVAAVGAVASMFFSKKLTEATEYKAKIEEFEEKSKTARDVMKQIGRRSDELKDVMQQLGERTINQLIYLEPLIYDFTPDDEYFRETFRKSMLLSSEISKLAQIPVIDKNGELNIESAKAKQEITRFLNKEL